MSLFDIIPTRQNKSNRVSFYMPGHNCGLLLPNRFKSKLYRYDTTEVDCFDDYHKPKRIIKNSEKMLSKVFDSISSFYLVNGSTSGILAGMSFLFKENKKVLIPRDCHKSIINGLIVTGATPVYITPKYDAVLDMTLPTTLQDIKKAHNKNSDIEGIVLTYPNYYGLYPTNLREIIKYCKQQGLKVLLDESHGAHLYFTDFKKKLGNLCNADIVVNSCHKNLFGLTQTAMLHVNNNEYSSKDIKNHISLYKTTSPSYILLASIDYTRKIYKVNGEKILEDTEKISGYMQELLKKYKIQYIKEFPTDYFIDPTKVTVMFDHSNVAAKVGRFLNAHGVYPELIEGRKMLFLLKPNHSKKDIKKTVLLIKRGLNGFNLEEKNELKFELPSQMQQAITPRTAFYNSSKWVPIRKAIGKVSNNTITPYPPGIPIVMPGEVITKEAIDYIQKFIGVIHGIEGGHIQVNR
ncbi:aminotransferase class I/II-fold pyridoxal phosphate-dependent enzyme [Proteinivorax hydrogeniformans]|uniref:Aminotransferase class I/II-fold pyridoxal phosphate-dependent enzyme n=1 Tax=Proteinivorax hydrogeniformans TaxID=1826727 RepID=A0AAU8HT66_9FIRM